MDKNEIARVCAEQGMNWPEAVTAVAAFACVAAIGWALLR